MLGLNICMVFERLNALAHGSFRVMLAGVGIGSLLSLSRLRVGGTLI